MRIGYQIKNARECAGLSQRELAAKLGCESWQWLSAVECGRKPATLAMLERIAAALGLRVDVHLRRG